MNALGLVLLVSSKSVSNGKLDTTVQLIEILDVHKVLFFLFQSVCLLNVSLFPSFRNTWTSDTDTSVLFSLQKWLIIMF